MKEPEMGRRRVAEKKNACANEIENASFIIQSSIQEYDSSCRLHLGFKFKPIPLMPCYMVTNKGG